MRTKRIADCHKIRHCFQCDNFVDCESVTDRCEIAKDCLSEWRECKDCPDGINPHYEGMCLDEL